MDLRSYIQLKEAYVKMYHPQAEVVSEEVEYVEEEILNEAGLNAGAGHKNTDTKKDWANDPRWGVFGQLERQRRKVFGTERERRQANSYEKSVNDISKRQGTRVGSGTYTANDVAAETRGRRMADPNYKPGQNQASNVNAASAGPLATQNKQTQNKQTQNKQTQNTQTQNKTTTGGGGGGGGSTPAAKPQLTPQQKKDNATNAKYDQLRKSDPKAAKDFGMKASKEKFGNQLKPKTPNPLMKGMSKRPSSAYTANNDPASASNKPVKSSRLSKALGSVTGPGKPAPKPSAGASAAMGAAKPTPKLTTNKPNTFMSKGGSSAASSSGGNKFNAKAPKILNNSVDMSEFDIILEYLVDQGFPVEEALVMMVNMSSEKQEQILENRRAARSAGGYVDDSKKQTDPSKDGFTGISGSIKDIMRQNKEIEARNKKKTKKEEVESVDEALRGKEYTKAMGKLKKDLGVEDDKKEKENPMRGAGYVKAMAKLKKNLGVSEEVGSIEENRRAARSAGGYVDDSKKQTDPSKDGFTGISGSIKDIMRQNKEIEARNKKKTKKEEMASLYQAYLSMYTEEESDESDYVDEGYVEFDKDRGPRKPSPRGKLVTKASEKRLGNILSPHHRDAKKQGERAEKMSKVKDTHDPEKAKAKEEENRNKGESKTQKEHMDSLYQAYLSMYTEEESDKEKDKHLERGGHSARTDYTKPPKGTGPMSDEEKEKSRKASMSAVEKVKADFMAKYGKGAIMDTKKKED